MIEMASTTQAALHPLLEQMTTRHGFERLTIETFDAFVAQPGHTLLAFTEDPVRYKETLDLAVILPEIVRACGGLRSGVLLPELARQIAPRYGFARWPAFVVLKDGDYIGAVDGLRNWDEYLKETTELLAREPRRAPTVGIPVRAAGAAVSNCQS